MKKARNYYAAHSYMGLNFTYSSPCWKVAKFDTKKERDQWVYDNEYNGQNYVAEKCTAKIARIILGCDPTDSNRVVHGHHGPYIQRVY